MNFCLRALVCLLLVACAPALNWRDVSEPALSLRMQFPCKPQRLAEGDTGMLQCEADGRRFVLSWRSLGEPAKTRDALAALAPLLAGRLKARAEAWTEAPLPQGALAWPGSGRFALRGGEREAWLQAWAQGSILVQALVIGGQASEPAQIFFDSLHRPA